MRTLETITPEYKEAVQKWIRMVTWLKHNRAKGRCEICGRKDRPLNGHHKRIPNNGEHNEDNCVICCNECYESRVLTGLLQKTWVLTEKDTRIAGQLRRNAQSSSGARLKRTLECRNNGGNGKVKQSMTGNKCPFCGLSLRRSSHQYSRLASYRQNGETVIGHRECPPSRVASSRRKQS